VTDPRSVLVIGAQGALGRVCVEKLRDRGFGVIRAGRRPENAPDFRLVDLDEPQSVADACSGVDLVVTTVRHSGHAAEHAVARDGGMLLSVASLRASDRAELKEDEKEARGLVVLHAGGAPGTYTLILKEMLAEHPDADGLEIAATFSLLQGSGRGATVDFAYPVLTSARRHPTRVFEFRAPIGRRRCMLVAGPEVGFFGELADGRSARVYVGLLERWAQAEFLTLNALGLWKRLPLGFFTAGSAWKSRRTTTEPRRDILAVTRGEERLAACAVEFSGDYQATAVATVMFSEALLARRAADPTLRGVIGAEEMFDLSEFRDGIDRSGTRIVPLT
jgi:NAD(P)-dependent dehydrogenase (short-subunit alcohol dehydrogenase family)